MTTDTQPTIVAANPLPADVDWSRVESTLGVRIVQGTPWSEVVDPAALGEGEDGLLGSVADPVDRVRQVSELLRACGFPEVGSLLRSDSDVLAGFIEGFAAGQHVGAPESSAIGVTEGSDVEGPASADSSTSRGCHCGGVNLALVEFAIFADKAGAELHQSAECFAITELSYERKWSS